MGKTKTAKISSVPDNELSGKEKYALKQKKKQEQQVKLDKKGKGAVGGVGLKGGERIKVIGADLSVEESETETTSAEASAKRGGPKVRSKKYQTNLSKIDKNKLYSVSEAVKLVKETSFSKFDGTVELHLNIKKLGLNARFELPHTSGKSKTIEIASDKTIEKLKKGKVDFDVLLSTPEMMPKLIAFAKLLGPKGLLPNPKTGTLIKSRTDAKKFSLDKITVKTERKAPVIHTVVGKVSQKEKELEENIEAVIAAVTTRQILKATLASTMGPGVKIEVK